MKIVFAVFLLVVIVFISGCAQQQEKPATNEQPVSEALSFVCRGAGNATAYRLDSNADIVDKANSFFALNSKCNLFTKCDIAIENNTGFVLYALNADNETEKKIFEDVNFKAYIGIEAYEDDNNKKVLTVIDKSYPVEYINSQAVIVDGKHIARNSKFDLNGIELKFYDFKIAPIFQALAFEGKDVIAVLDDPQLTRIFRDADGLGRYSILIQLSNESAKRLRDFVAELPVSLVFGSAGQQAASLKAKIYYYDNDALLAYAPLPAELKTNQEANLLTIVGVFENPVVAVNQFEWLRNGLKLYGYPKIKIVSTKKFDCRDIPENK